MCLPRAARAGAAVVGIGVIVGVGVTLARVASGASGAGAVPLALHCRASLQIQQKKELSSLRQATMATGKRGFGSQRFKKNWSAYISTPLGSEQAISGFEITTL